MHRLLIVSVAVWFLVGVAAFGQEPAKDKSTKQIPAAGAQRVAISGPFPLETVNNYQVPTAIATIIGLLFLAFILFQLVMLRSSVDRLNDRLSQSPPPQA